MKYSILFFGTPSFATPILEALHKEHAIIGVVTQPDKPVGRKQLLAPPPIKVLADKLNLPVYQPEKAEDIVDQINERVDFIVTAAYGQYLPSKVLQLPFKDALNVHPSLLPKYRGATPMQSALLNGDEKTGVSILRMTKEMDAGPLFSQEQFPIPEEWKYSDLEKKCSAIGAELLLSVLKNYHSLSPQDQGREGLSHCVKINKQDGVILWKEETAEQIWNKLRAFTPWPGVYTFWKGQKLSLQEFSAKLEDSPGVPPGTVCSRNDDILVQTQKGSLQLIEIQLAGKNKANIHDFINGHRDFIGSRLNHSSSAS